MGYSQSTLNQTTAGNLSINYRISTVTCVPGACETDTIMFDIDSCPKATFRCNESGQIDFDNVLSQLNDQTTDSLGDSIRELNMHDDGLMYNHLRNIIFADSTSALLVLENEVSQQLDSNDYKIDMYVTVPK